MRRKGFLQESRAAPSSLSSLPSLGMHIAIISHLRTTPFLDTRRLSKGASKGNGANSPEEMHFPRKSKLEMDVRMKKVCLLLLTQLAETLAESPPQLLHFGEGAFLFTHGEACKMGRELAD